MKKYLESVFREAAVKLPYLTEIPVFFERPKNESFGDLSSNAAMMLAKILKRKPMDIATEITGALVTDPVYIKSVDIAAPGFINFSFADSYINTIVSQVVSSGERFGKSDKHSGKKALVEFVSANPTGPLTVGHGRNAVSGDTIATLLSTVGYNVNREYYFNNAGRQMRVLGDSVRLRYIQLLGKEIEFPEDYYQGEYITEIARTLIEEFGNTLESTEEVDLFKDRAEQEIFKDISKTLGSLGIVFDSYYNENTLYTDGKIDAVLKEFTDKGLSYTSEGATWLKLTELGQESDKVIIKSTGEPTYRLPDIAYHITKFDRGYDLIVDLFGSDHNATYSDVLAGLRALGHDTDKIKVLIHQFVTILQNNEIVKMSTRKANFITLDELVQETGADAVRYFFNMRSISTHLNFDLEIAKKQTDENPVFYLQYAHARICSIVRMAEGEKISASTEGVYGFEHEDEIRLLKKLWQYEGEVLLAAENFEPQRITVYLEELAGLFHRFYTSCRIIGSPQKTAEDRLALCLAVRQVLRNGLSILGVSAPERM